MLLNSAYIQKAMDLSFNYLEEVTNANITDIFTVREIKKNIILISNSCLTQHLHRGEKEMDKYHLDMANKFIVDDFNTYLLTQSNT
jgi:hypothetical protein